MLKNILIIAFVAMSLIVKSQETKKVLFIGNSYTYVNDLPNIVYNLASTNSDTLIYDSSTPGGYNFNSHTTDATTLSKISQTDWDFVVLQSQSQEPAFPPSQVAVDVYPYAKILVDSTKANNICTEPLFFMTWGRKYGDQSNCAAYPPICTYLGMQQRLRESYLEMGQTNHASVAPVGMAWKHSIVSSPTLNLYSSDNSHPSLNGSYLSACVFYAMIFEKSPIGIPYHAGLEPDTAEFLQNIAHYTVFDSLFMWKSTDVIPTSNFSYTINNGNVQFANTSIESEEYYWDFGDGNVSTLENPSNNYTASGNYIVKLETVSITCDTSTYIDTINVVIVNLDDNLFENGIIISPNPASNILTIEIEAVLANQGVKCSLIDVYGNLVKRVSIINTQTTIDISDLPKGMYFICIGNSENTSINKIIIN